MIQIINKTKCCGCNACVQRCPKQCITMYEDEEGFLYPKVNQATCIDCGLCDKVCPILKQETPRYPLQIFAAKNRNEEQRLRSSSGGIFILLAEYILNLGGVVFGARFNKNWEVEHTYAETIEDLPPLMRSKYVQSHIGNTYKKAEQFLKQGRQVLFVGTSCQIAGLKKFLRKDYNNLLSIDFICHGVPSPGIWRNYLEQIKLELKEESNKKSNLAFSPQGKPIITNINFREKLLNNYGWKNYGFVVYSKQFPTNDSDTILLSSPNKMNIYMKGFLANLYLRPSCYKCPAKAGRSISDITIGDFWGITKFRPEFDDDKGIGAVLAYTSKGKAILNSINAELIEMSYSEVIDSNPSIHTSATLTKKRKQFWKEYHKTKNLTYSIICAEKMNWDDKIQYWLKKIIQKFQSILVR